MFGVKMTDKTKILLTPEDFKPSFAKWSILGVFNPGAVRLPNGKIMMYVRISEEGIKHKDGKIFMCPIVTSKNKYGVEYKKILEEEILKTGRWNEVYLKNGTCILPHISHLRRVILNENGFDIEKIEQKPIFAGMPKESDYGVEDPRISEIDGRYYMTYVGVSTSEGVSTYLAVSDDLKKWNRLGLIFREQNKDVVLFPEKINGEYVALNRPESLFSFSKPGIWISYSKDLIYWGKDSNLMRPRGPETWEADRIGAGCPPIKTSKGWLVIYHGVSEEKDRLFYSVGVVLLDLKNPKKIIARSDPKTPFILPDKKFEKEGYINNIIFPTVAIPTLDGKSLLIYSGGADRIVSVRKISFKEIFKHLRV
ncbi:hypothetical protein COX97_01855 [Candidatus Pacearchaeota archaeon CG_4_10_14_0_2_um_filter_05_32_18]|nr:MAG: hypothetical protein COX97_01855 [Candidatus Pacearchaeota archaeon CG_4_10_14_0_2_um_filter_05_32_18]